MNECCIVVHWNSDEGLTTRVFWDELDARKSMESQIEATIKALRAKGYTPTVERNGWDNVVITANTSDPSAPELCYKWSIIISEIS